MEDLHLFVLFAVLSIINALLQSVNMITTVKCSKGVAALVSGITFGFYTVVVVYTVCELPLFAKVLTVVIANLIGVFVGKTIEEKLRQDKVWKFEVFLSKYEVIPELERLEIPCIVTESLDERKTVVYNFYCKTQKESERVIEICQESDVKYFITEGVE